MNKPMIAGGGFALMAWQLARSRVRHPTPTVRYNASRGDIARSAPGCFPVHREYYKILDEADRMTGLGWNMRRHRICQTVTL